MRIRRVVVGAAAAATSLGGGVFVGFLGCDGDASWASLGGADALTFSPSTIALLPADPDGDEDGGVTVGSRRTITLFGTKIAGQGGESAGDNRPAEGAHIDVVLGDKCPSSLSEGGAGATSGEAEDPTQYVHLIAAAAGDSTGTCHRISDALVRCVLAADGSASFDAQATSNIRYSGPISLIACAGTTMRASAKIRVGNPLPEGAYLEFAPKKLELSRHPISCKGDPLIPCDFPALHRVAPMEIRLYQHQDGDPSDAGTPIHGTPVDLEVTLSPQNVEGKTPSGLSTWISKSDQCSEKDTSLLVQIVGSSATFFVCADGQAGSFDLDAIALGTYASAASATRGAATVSVEAQPAQVTVSDACTTKTGMQGVQVTVLDCEGQPLKSLDVTSDQTQKTGTSGMTDCFAPTTAGSDFSLLVCNGLVSLKTKGTP